MLAEAGAVPGVDVRGGAPLFLNAGDRATTAGTVVTGVMRDEAERNPAVAAFLARTTERLYLLKAQREYELLALDAEARYLAFRARFAKLEDQIQLKQVASYVGITPEHLSRLRQRLAGA